tara:strand:- start:131 stop:952 length:822 start_codon:yes stop_codon:yes gene_type:complete
MNRSLGIRNFFDANGYYLIKKLFNKQECKNFRMAMNKHFKLSECELKQKEIDSQTFVEPDGLTKNKNFWEIIFNQKILKVVREIIGDDISYTQHSDLHINLGAGKYHRDNVDRFYKKGPDWNEKNQDYKVVRVAVYLSDYSKSGSSLVIFPNSNKKETFINKLEFRFWNLIRLKWTSFFNKNKLPHIFLSAKMKKIKNSEGDCIIFDQRLIHAGGVIKGPYPKYACYLSYGAKNNEHTTNHHNYYLSRPTYLKEIPKDLKKKLEKSYLLFPKK